MINDRSFSDGLNEIKEAFAPSKKIKKNRQKIVMPKLNPAYLFVLTPFLYIYSVYTFWINIPLTIFLILLQIIIWFVIGREVSKSNYLIILLTAWFALSIPLMNDLISKL